ncbi:hypothetical protein RJT34_16392 [Clitoria ternatea]|uniref:Uncharacterized protein n=1 Tax=Clitoria ternatea TaxID=43366 RepID=A0AAN9PDM1_CLITE
MTSHTKILFAMEKAHLVMIGDENFAPNPEEDEKKFKIWLDQVFILFSIQEKTHVFLGPIEHPPHVLDASFKEFFPSIQEESILAFKDPIKVDFMKGISHVFRGTQLSNQINGFLGITNTFHIPYGMITPTLLDVAVITGLRLDGKAYSPKSKPRSLIEPD